MPDLLLELFSEEIPARMQGKAADDLKKMVTDRLVDAGLVYEGARAFVTPRRLALIVQGVPARQPDLKEERKGPRVGAPEGAIAGFLKAAGLGSIGEATIQKDPKKGDFYIALTEKAGRPAIDVIGEFLQIVLRTFPWPKSMRWGEASAQPGSLEWVRPLHAIVATFGPETEEPEIVHVATGGITSGNTTYGHRFLSPGAIQVRHFGDYVTSLERAKVVLDPARRREIILHDAKNLAFAQGYELVEDEGLLNEVAGLVEWPVVLMGTFEESFLKIPPEVIRATIRNNQKCFVVTRAADSASPPPGGGRSAGAAGRDGVTANAASTASPHPGPSGRPSPSSGRLRPSSAGYGRGLEPAALAPRFILVANTEAADGGKEIIAGNARVIRARLSDAKFFYETDLKIRLEDRLPKFKDIIFHEKLGTQAERIERIERLAGELAPLVGADVEKAKRAARLCKTDLLTEVVGEFPEVQGTMGKYYALQQGEDEAVAHAIEDHYRPKGPDDLVPADPVSIAVALADKIDTLVGFWAIDEKPTGSKDPYALRRAALGVIRLVIENQRKINLVSVFDGHAQAFKPNGAIETKWADRNVRTTSVDLLSFLADRLKVQLREQGARHDLVDAVFALEGQDDLLMVVRRVEALGQFLDTDDGRNLLAGTKRAANILRIEEKKDGKTYDAAPDVSLYSLAEEKTLAKAIDQVRAEAASAVAKEEFGSAMSALAKLRPAVDAFFDKVKVNDDDLKVRENRLKLLNQIREATRTVADFSKIQD